MNRRPRRRAGFASYLLAMLLGACAAGQTPVPLPEGPIRYLDLPSFEQQVSQALSANPESVRIVFYDKVKPSLLPERITQLMGAVESGGSEVKVVLPPGELQPRGLPLLSLLPGLWNFLKDRTRQPVFKDAVKGYDAQIILKRDDTGDRLVEAIVLVRR